MSFQTSALLLSWVAILLLSLVVAGLVRQVHALRQGPPPPEPALGPGAGTPAPEFDRLGPGLLLFLDDGCGACTDVLAAAETLDRPVRAVYAGPAPATGVPTLADEQGLFDAYRIPATPFAVLVDEHGRVRTAEPIGGATALYELVNTEVVR